MAELPLLKDVGNKQKEIRLYKVHFWCRTIKIRFQKRTFYLQANMSGRLKCIPDRMWWKAQVLAGACGWKSGISVL